MGGFSLLLHCSHLISIGRWLADMSLRLACLLIGGRRRRGRSRIGLFGSERWHTRQFRQIAVLPVSILEFGCPTSGIRTHPLPFGIWQHRLFQTHFRVIGVPGGCLASSSLFLDEMFSSSYIHFDVPLK